MTAIGAEEDSIPYEFSITSVARTETKVAGFDETGAPSTNGEAQFAKKEVKQLPDATEFDEIGELSTNGGAEFTKKKSKLPLDGTESTNETTELVKSGTEDGEDG